MTDRAVAASSDRAALDAFAALTEAVLHATDLVQMAQQAVEVLQRLAPHLSVVFYQRQGEHLIGSVVSENTPADAASVARQGLSPDLAVFADTILRRQVTFVDARNTDAPEIDDRETDDRAIPEAQPHGVAAFYPYFADEDRSLQALLAIGSVQLQQWDEHTKTVFTAVGHSLDLARQRLTTQTHQNLEHQELDIFVAFTEATSRVGNVQALARLAVDTLETLIPESVPAVYELRPSAWMVLSLGQEADPELAAVLHAGLPLQTPMFAQARQTREPVFVDDWDGDVQQIRYSEDFKTEASIPVILEGKVVAMLTVGCKIRSCWSERDRTIMRSVGRSFSLLYDRISTAQRLQEQETEAISRTRALEAFAELTNDLDVRLDPALLVRRAQEIALSLLPQGYAAYFERQAGLWRVTSQVGNAGLPALQDAIDGGFPVGQTPTLDAAYVSGEPHFVDVYAPDTDIDPGVAGHLGAAACLPVFIRGEFSGIFNVPLFQTKSWSAADRAVLVSIVRSLGLALEGSQSMIQLAERSKELEQVNEELRAANNDLEAFTYSASHDLRTPIRHVMGFTELALTAYRKEKPELGEQHLGVVKQAALRMTALIDGMLVLSRSGRQDLNWQPVDLNDVVTQARRDAGAEFAGQPVRWQIGTLPRVRGDRGMLQQVMTNLLSNAVKYSAKRSQSEVRVWAEDQGADWRISVQDNGVGFDPRYTQKLFGIFQRLHPEREFKGTGVGLATVRRIVLKHGGQVFADSPDDSGAVFSFTLPKQGGL
ncbi:ATP-binding protein [Deinococcus sp. UYEF24]